MDYRVGSRVELKVAGDYVVGTIEAIDPRTGELSVRLRDNDWTTQLDPARIVDVF